MTSGPMRRRLAPAPSLLRQRRIAIHTQRFVISKSSDSSGSTSTSNLRSIPSKRTLAQVRPEPLSELWFTPSSPGRSPADDLLGSASDHGKGDRKPPDERILKLGKTLRTLSPLLPNILTSPLPPEILSPSISLHLFPSTHPHLPAVKGRVPYRAALWTAPVAWGCVPIVGNVKIQVLSEKIVRTGFHNTPRDEDTEADLGEEKLVVRWKTENKTSTTSTSSPSVNNNDPNIPIPSDNPIPFPNQTSDQSNSSATTGINRGLSVLLGGNKPIFNVSNDDQFSGIFIFSFDTKGRIATHTIEHADENSGYDKTLKVVTLTDWLLGKAKWGRQTREEELIPGLAMRVCRDEWARGPGGRELR